MAHDNFKVGPEGELRNRTFHRDIVSLTLFQDLFLKNFVKADPSKSAYGFTLNCRKPGHLISVSWQKKALPFKPG